MERAPSVIGRQDGGLVVRRRRGRGTCTPVPEGARLASPEILKRGCDISCVRACVRRPGRKRGTESAPRHRSLSLGTLAVTNYINADGTSRAIAVFTARLSSPSRRHTTGPATLYQRPGEGCAEGGIYRAGRGGRETGITGHQSRESPASRRESATAPEAANPPPSPRFLFLHSPRSRHLPLFPPPLARSASLTSFASFRRETTGASLVVFHRGPGEICKLR